MIDCVVIRAEQYVFCTDVYTYKWWVVGLTTTWLELKWELRLLVNRREVTVHTAVQSRRQALLAVTWNGWTLVESWGCDQCICRSRPQHTRPATTTYNTKSTSPHSVDLKVTYWVKALRRYCVSVARIRNTRSFIPDVHLQVLKNEQCEMGALGLHWMKGQQRSNNYCVPWVVLLVTKVMI